MNSGVFAKVLPERRTLPVLAIRAKQPRDELWSETSRGPGLLRFARNDGAGIDQTSRSTIIFLISAMALAGFRFLGQVFAQFMIVWQR
ncbi:hypothetical protein KHHGKMAE_4738 [Methylobacterium persicinum]|nr:hypothetical protein KHHGKMAE_4738 [Methylobacterium persicinum]